MSKFEKTPSRREIIVGAGQAAAASALAACGSKENTNQDLGSGDMRMPADMRMQSDLRPPPDLRPPDDLFVPCMPTVATGAELLAVGEGKSFPDAQYPSRSYFVARDAGGFFALRNVCSHQGCQVGYNTAAKTYDCPCHGSRYNLDGTVLMGPTTMSLRSFPLSKRGDGTLEVDPCGPGSTDISGRVT